MEIAIVRAVLTGDVGAWKELWTHAEPIVERISRDWRKVGRLSDRDDERASIKLVVMAALFAKDYCRLRAYVSACDEAARDGRAPPKFESWLSTVGTRLAIDYMRAHPEYSDRRRRSDDEQSDRWARHVPLDNVAAAIDGDRSLRNVFDAVDHVALLEVLEAVRERLAPAQRDALLGEFRGDSLDETASRMGLSSHEVRGLLRSAKEKLRYHLRDGSTEDEQ